jgi:hypothetical protein
MSITITSTTDSEETVQDATGDKQETVEEQNSESSEESQDETTEESETSEENDSEVEESESDDESEDDDSDDDDLAAKEKPKKKSGFKKRIERFQRRLSEKDERIAHLERLAFEKSSNQDDSVEKPVESVAVTEDKPQQDDFETHEEWVDALTDWKLEKREADRLSKERANQAKSAIQEQTETFQGRVQEFSKKHTDFKEVIEDVDDIKLSLGLQEALLSSEVGPNVMYELAQNRDEYARINSLSPIQAAKEIGKIEARISSSISESTNQNTKVKTTKVPKPIQPVGSSGGGGSSTKSPDKMSYQEYKKWRAKSG